MTTAIAPSSKQEQSPEVAITTSTDANIMETAILAIGAARFGALVLQAENRVKKLPRQTRIMLAMASFLLPLAWPYLLTWAKIAQISLEERFPFLATLIATEQEDKEEA